VILAPVGPISCRRNILPNDWGEIEGKDFGARREIWRTYLVGVGCEVIVGIDEPIVCYTVSSVE